jgi:chemotaxis protein CheX
VLNVEYINPFIAATLQALEVTTNLRPARGKPRVRRERYAQGDVTAIITLAGPSRGTIALSLPASLAIRLYSEMVGEEANELSEEVLDAVGEIGNMVAGGAKAVLSQQGFSFKISIPEILVGKDRSIPHLGSAPCLVVPFHLESDTFWLEVSLEEK